MLLLASQGYWDVRLRHRARRRQRRPGARGAAERAREIAQRLGRPDLELMALDSISAGLNIRGLYGFAEPIDRERLELARPVRDPFEVGDTLLHGRVVGPRRSATTASVVALAAEFEALDARTSRRSGHLATAVLARLPLGDWDEALAEQARLRELFGEPANRPPSMASGGHGAEALIHEARGEVAAADAVPRRDRVVEHRRRAAAALGDAARRRSPLARRGDFAARPRPISARDRADSSGIYLADASSRRAAR